MREIEGERARQREREGGRQRDRETEREREREREGEIEREREKESESERDRGRESETEREKSESMFMQVFTDLFKFDCETSKFCLCKSRSIPFPEPNSRLTYYKSNSLSTGPRPPI